MKDLRQFDKFRIPPEVAGPSQAYRNDPEIAKVSGAFSFRLTAGSPTSFIVIASSGQGWDHLSVSTNDRCPTWAEMDAIKRIFFKPDEVAMQLHLPPSDHVNIHPYTLHIWRPHGVKRAIPLPPPEFV